MPVLTSTMIALARMRVGERVDPEDGGAGGSGKKGPPPIHSRGEIGEAGGIPEKEAGRTQEAGESANGEVVDG